MRFIDTDILFYAFDRTQGKKHEESKAISKKISLGEAEGCVSNQVLSELYNALSIKLNEKQTPLTIITGILEIDSWKKFKYSAESVAPAARLSQEFEVPFWNALNAQTMLENQVHEIITEDPSFSKIPGIKAFNPFK